MFRAHASASRLGRGGRRGTFSRCRTTCFSIGVHVEFHLRLRVCAPGSWADDLKVRVECFGPKLGFKALSSGDSIWIRGVIARKGLSGIP